MSRHQNTRYLVLHKDTPEITSTAQQILGKKVSYKFNAWYENDWKNKGFTTPTLNYQGPGNSSRQGEPVNEPDRFAQKHDLQYAHASYRYKKGKLTQQQFENEIRKSDAEFLGKNYNHITSFNSSYDKFFSWVGLLGIGAKNTYEKGFGQVYPSLDKTEHDFSVPNTDEPIVHTLNENSLATKLLKTLKTNVSKKQAAKASSSMGLPEEPQKKKQKIGETSGGNPATPAQSPLAIPDIEMASLTGTGKESASGGASSDGMELYTIDRPLSNFEGRVNTYTKVHKFMTFGLAPAIIVPNPGNPSADPPIPSNPATYLTSWLAEIPVQIPALYLNQSEFDLLQDGSHVVSVDVSVVYRGSTIQFETNASSSALATLNQINDIGVAIGLNRTGWGSNVRFSSFNGTQPMLPTGIRQPLYEPEAGVYRGMVRDYYGSRNLDSNFTNDVPKHQVGRQTFLYNYWANSLNGNTQEEGKQTYGGWPCLASKIEQMDGKTAVNTVVANYSYKPKMAPLKTPLRMASHGLPFPDQNGSMVVPGTALSNTRMSQINRTDTAPGSSTGIFSKIGELQTDRLNEPANGPFLSIYTMIEKSQACQTGFWGLNNGHIQPSLHVGVQPVPALTTSATLTENNQFNNWTDSRAYWEVTATMKVMEKAPTEWPYAQFPNVPAGDVIMWAPQSNRPAVFNDNKQDGATFGSLYTNSIPQINAL
uniref:VP1 n=1 Tax=Phylloscopus inornatus ambidensovirus TaxID=2794452 RepID=A0A8E7G1V7_9VIRU|nr:MAG: VP1 [Phylloscopus inornatus ambidensovirus]